MGQLFYHGLAPAVVQESSIAFTDFTNTNTYIFTFTDLNTGATQAITFTIATATDSTLALMVTRIAAVLTAAAATKPLIQALTVTSDGATLVNIRAKVAGCPWSLAITGSATAPTTTVITANSGPHDFLCAGNYAGGVVPTGADHIVFFGTCLYNLYQDSTTYGKITLARGPNGTVPEVGNITSPAFRMTCTALDVYDGKFNIDIKGSAITVNVYNTANAGQGVLAGNLSGSATTAINHYGGSVGYSPYAGDADTDTTLNVYGGTFIVGAGLTLTTFNLLGGRGELKAACTTLNALAGDLTINGVGAITTVNQTAANIISNTSGTIGTWTRKGAGIADFTKSRVARTISTAVWGGSIGGVFYDSTILTRSSESFPTTGSAVDGPVANYQAAA